MSTYATAVTNVYVESSYRPGALNPSRELQYFYVSFDVGGVGCRLFGDYANEEDAQVRLDEFTLQLRN